jgi:filamentous hemagglutinin
MEQAQSDPMAGKLLRLKITDPRWHSDSGWDKYSQNVNGVEVHYVVNRFTGDVDDFKFKDLN